MEWFRKGAFMILQVIIEWFIEYVVNTIRWLDYPHTHSLGVCFIYCQPEQATGQIVELPVIRGATTLSCHVGLLHWDFTKPDL